MPEAPRDPMSRLGAAAAQMHELYLSYVEGGFTEEQALRIIIGILSTN